MNNWSGLFVILNKCRCYNLSVVFHWQNHLLEAGWNKSETTQHDIEKTLNCCGFSSFTNDTVCVAVSKPYWITLLFLFHQQRDLDFHDVVPGSVWKMFTITSSSSRHALITLHRLVKPAQPSFSSMLGRCYTLWVVLDCSSVLQRSVTCDWPEKGKKWNLVSQHWHLFILYILSDPWSLARPQIQKSQRSQVKSWRLSITSHSSINPKCTSENNPLCSFTYLNVCVV